MIYTDDIKDYCLAIYADGMTAARVRDATGVSKSTILRWAHKAGIAKSRSEANKIQWRPRKQRIRTRTEKLCPVCERVLPTASFRNNASRPDGKEQYCKSCKSEYGARYNTGRVHERWIDDSDKDAIVARYALGHSSADIASAYRCSESSVLRLVNDSEVHTRLSGRRQYSVDESYFTTIDDPVRAYWFGFLAADGYVSEDHGYIRLALKASDKSHIEKFVECLRYSGEIEYTESTHSYRVTISSVRIARDLASHGLKQGKTHILKPWRGPSHLLAHYWRGYFDGDGSLCRTTNRRRWLLSLVGTHSVVQAFSDFLKDRIGYSMPVYPHKSIFEAKSGGLHKVQDTLSVLYGQAPIALDRKYKLARAALSQPRKRPPFRNQDTLFHAKNTP